MRGILRRINGSLDPTTEQIQQYLRARPRHVKFGPYVEQYNRGARGAVTGEQES